MVFGILAPSADEWRIFERMRDGERLYIEDVYDLKDAPFTWRGNLSYDRSVRGTHLSGRQLNSMKDGHWIVYDVELNECVLTHEGREALRLYRPSTTSNRVIRRKRGE